MSTAIYKYALSVDDVQRLRMPRSAKLLSVQVQRGIPCVWAWHDPSEVAGEVEFRTIGTGHRIDGSPGEFLGTYQLDEGGLVFHVFYRWP